MLRFAKPAGFQGIVALRCGQNTKRLGVSMDVIARGIAGWWIDHGMDHSILTIRLFKHVQTIDIHVSGRDIQGMRLCTLGSVQ